jgi:glucosamine-6-phosphate deaminase
MIAPTVFVDAACLGRALAREIVDGLTAAAATGRHFVLGCPGGRSPASTYAALAQLVEAEHVDLSRLVIVMMDDYVQQTTDGFVTVDAQQHYSVARFACDHIVGPLNRAAGPGHGITPDRVLHPDPVHPEGYDVALLALGSVDLFILASGDSDGHVAFNPPGSELTSITRVIPLAESTRRDNLATFPQFDSLEQVPRFGVSIGVGTIRAVARRAVLVAVGPAKRMAVQRLTSVDGYDPTWPATVLVCCSNPSLYTDDAAMPDPPDTAAPTHAERSH